MKTFFKVVTLAVVMASSFTVNAANNVQKIAVVFPSKIIQQSPKLEQIKKKLEAEFKGSYEALQLMEKQLTTMNGKLDRDAEMMAADEVASLRRKVEVKLLEYKLERKAFEENNRRRQNEEEQKAFKQVHAVINAVALKEGYDLVLNGEQVIFSKPALDISNTVIKEISKK